MGCLLWEFWEKIWPRYNGISLYVQDRPQFSRQYVMIIHLKYVVENTYWTCVLFLRSFWLGMSIFTLSRLISNVCRPKWLSNWHDISKQWYWGQWHEFLESIVCRQNCSNCSCSGGLQNMLGCIEKWSWMHFTHAKRGTVAYFAC